MTTAMIEAKMGIEVIERKMEGKVTGPPIWEDIAEDSVERPARPLTFGDMPFFVTKRKFAL